MQWMDDINMKKQVIFIPYPLNNYIEQLYYELLQLEHLCPLITKNKEQHIIKIQKKQLELLTAQSYVLEHFAPQAKNKKFIINFNISALIVEV